MEVLRISDSELRSYIHDFTSMHLKNKSEETKGTYSRALREFEKYFAKSKSWFCFKKEDMEKYKEYLCNEKRLLPSSVSTYLTSVRKFIDFLVERNILKENQAKKVKGNSRPKKHTIRPLTEAEIMKFFSVIPTDSPQDFRDYLIARLMVESAATESELAKANISDLVRYSTHYTLFVQAKGKKVKNESVEISLELGGQIHSYISLRDKPIEQNSALFVSHSRLVKNRHMTTRAIHSRLSTWLEKAGLSKRRDVTPSSLRHTAAKLWLERDKLPLREVKRRMRHRMISTTKFYT